MKKFTRVFAIVLAAVMLMSLASCSLAPTEEVDVTNDNIEIGVLLSGEQDATTGMSGAALNAINELTSIGYGINGERFKYADKANPDDAEGTAEAIQSLLNFECHVILATEAGYLDDIQKFAAENEGVIFLVLGAENDGKNIYGYDANITAADYFAGIVAGMKAAEFKATKLGYLAKSEADLTNLNAFAMGVKSVNAQATIDAVIGTDAAGVDKLIQGGAAIIAADYEDEAIVTACTDAKVPFIGFGSETYKDAETFLCAPVYNFTQIYIDAFKAVVDAKDIPALEGNYISGATYLSDINENLAAEGTQAAVDAAVNALADGSLALEISVDTPFENVTIVK